MGVLRAPGRRDVGALASGNAENWEAGPYRGLDCFVFNPGGQLQGTMSGSQL